MVPSFGVFRITGSRKEVEHVLKTSNELVWIAEYNSACIRELSALIGAPDQRLKPAVEFFTKSKDGKTALAAIQDKLKNEKVLDLNRSVNFPSDVEIDAALDVILDTVPPSDVTAIQISTKQTSEYSSDLEQLDKSIVSSIFLKLPNLKEVDLAGCGNYVTNQVVQELVQYHPNLSKLNLEQCIQLTSDAGTAISLLDNLDYLNIGKHHELNNAFIERLSEGCESLQTLIIAQAALTLDVFVPLAKFKNLKHIELPFTLKGTPEAQKYQEEHPNVKVVMEPMMIDARFYGEWLPAVAVAFKCFETRVHFYGRSKYSEQSISKSNMKEDIAPFGTHKDRYCSQDQSHCAEKCELCEIFDPILRYTKFAGKPNFRFISDWFFTEPQGEEFLQRYIDQAKEGNISFPDSFVPPGLDVVTVMKALLEKIDATTVTSIELLDTNFNSVTLEILKSFPFIKSLHIKPHQYSYSTSTEDHERFASLVPTGLEELRLSGKISSVEFLARRCTNLKKLFFDVESYWGYSSLVAEFITENNKLEELRLRNTNIDLQTFKLVAERCRNITDLNITLDSKFNEDYIPFLINFFPNLKRLAVDLGVSKHPAFEEFKKFRPDVIVEDTKDLRDVLYYDNWYPALQVGENEFHVYGQDMYRPFAVSASELSSKTAPFLTHSVRYGMLQDQHVRIKCDHCNNISSVCEGLLFGGKPNPYFMWSWYFDTEPGKQLLAQFKPKEDNTILFDKDLPENIKPWAVVRALSKQLDKQKKYTLKFLKQYDTTEPELFTHQDLPIEAFEFAPNTTLHKEFLSQLLKFYPNITRLNLEQTKLPDNDNWEKFEFAELQWLDVSNIDDLNDAKLGGIAKCTKLNHLSLSGDHQITDAGIEELTRNLPNLTSLNLRRTSITEKSIELITLHCPNIQSLNLILCKITPACFKILAKGCPSLQEVKVPYHLVGTPELAAFKSSRPAVTVLEGTELADFEDNGTWWSGFILSETSQGCTAHCYGIEYPKMLKSSSVAPLLSHADQYGPQEESHASRPCEYCDLLHERFRNLKFGNSRNLAFVNDWFFSSEEGDKFIQKASSVIKESNVLDLGLPTPNGLKIEAVVKALLPAISPSDVKNLAVPHGASVELLDTILSFASDITSFSGNDLNDQHLKLVSEKCPKLVQLELNACNVTDGGLKLFSEKIHSLEIFALRVCKQVTDKGLEHIISTNKDISSLDLNVQLGLTVHSLTLASQLPKLHVLKVWGKPHDAQVENEVEKLKKNKRKFEFIQGPLLYDAVFAPMFTNDNPNDYWLPAVVTKYKEDEMELHAYGTGDDLTVYGQANESSKLSELLTQPKYRSMSGYHLKNQCTRCEEMKPIVQHLKFGGLHPSQLMKN